jgi:hypothetical protein
MIDAPKGELKGHGIKRRRKVKEFHDTQQQEPRHGFFSFCSRRKNASRASRGQHRPGISSHRIERNKNVKYRKSQELTAVIPQTKMSEWQQDTQLHFGIGLAGMQRSRISMRMVAIYEQEVLNGVVPERFFALASKDPASTYWSTRVEPDVAARG